MANFTYRKTGVRTLGYIITLLFSISVKSQQNKPILTNSVLEPIPTIIINEFLASNARANIDTDFGNCVDWLELYNSSNEY